MRAATPAQVREMDRLTIADGTDSFELMSRAADAVFRAMTSFVDSLDGLPVTVLCGPGNNGGDGFLVACRVADAGAVVDVFASTDNYQGDAARARDAWRGRGGAPPKPLGEATFSHRPLVVDALLGTGASGEPRAGFVEALERLRDARPPTVSVDVPSGVDALTGGAAATAVRADLTVTFAVPKLGLLREPARSHAGELRVADIGIADGAIERAGTVARVVTARDARLAVPPRSPAGHKGTFGHVLVAGGSPDLAGASVLATRGALRGGAGLVTTAVPAGTRDRVAVENPEATSIELPPAFDGTCAGESAEVVARFLDRHPRTVVALGPGLSRAAEAAAFARAVALDTVSTVVVDADALNAFEGAASALRGAAGPRVITPHPGEAARLLGVETAEIVSDPVAAAERLADETGAVVTLKGAPSLVADGNDVAINTTGNAGMARGGSGDVLTGLVAAFLAQGASPADAAVAANYVHGLAGDVAARRKTGWGMTAGDIARYLPNAFSLVVDERTVTPPISELR